MCRLKNKKREERGGKRRRRRRKKKRKELKFPAIGPFIVTWLVVVTSRTQGLRLFAAVSTCQTDTIGRLRGRPDVCRRWESIGTAFRSDCSPWWREKAGNPHRCNRAGHIGQPVFSPRANRWVGASRGSRLSPAPSPEKGLSLLSVFLFQCLGCVKLGKKELWNYLKLGLSVDQNHVDTAWCFKPRVSDV